MELSPFPRTWVPRTPRLESVADRGTTEELRVHAWRAEQLRRLGLPHGHAEVFADRVDWHAMARLVARGCSPTLALRILR